MYGIHWLPQNNVLENTKKTQIWKFWEKNDKIYLNIKNSKNKNIIVVQYTMVNYVHFSEKSCK